jgi:hypothetical protein
MFLTSTSDKINVVTSAAGTVNVHASYVDLDGSTSAVTPGRKNTAAISTATTTDVSGSPASGVYRKVKVLSIRNAHASTTNVVTVQHTDGTNVEELIKVSLAPGEQLLYSEFANWYVVNANGEQKTAVVSGTLLKTTQVTAAGAGSWTPDSRCATALVECWGAGGQGGGAATSSSTASQGGGGGGGAYSASRLSGAAIKVTSFSIGAKGSGAAAGATGNTGGDTTWDTTVIVAKGGAGGTVLAAGTTVGVAAGGAGGAAASGTGDRKISGGTGEKGTRLSGTQAIGGDGGAAAYLGTVGAGGVAAITGGTAGAAAAAGAYGAGGSGAGTLTTAVAGGAGQDGLVIITEYI